MHSASGTIMFKTTAAGNRIQVVSCFMDPLLLLLLLLVQVRYVPSGSKGGVIRQVFHKPPDASAPGSNCVVVSSYDAATGALLMRAKQRCTFTKAPVKV